MNNSDLLTYCMSKPGAEQSVHSDWKATQIKSTPALAELLREEHSDIIPSEHLNKSHWSTLFLDGSLKDSQIYYLVDASFQQVATAR